MTDNKLTDNEIIKALEVCSKYTGFKDCEKCPLKPNCDANVLETLSLDLINRLQAENEKLNKENENLLIRLCKKVNQESKAIEKLIKAEAYKECIEKVKMEAENATCVYEPDRPQADNMVYHISNIRIGNLLKELVGDK